jgi:hypothetical protein
MKISDQVRTRAAASTPTQNDVVEVFRKNLSTYSPEARNKMVEGLKKDLLALIMPLKGHREYYKRLEAYVEGLARRAHDLGEIHAQRMAKDLGDGIATFAEAIKKNWFE